MQCRGQNVEVQSPQLSSAETTHEVDRLAAEVVRRGRAALLLLLEAYQCARDLRRDVWDFAVEIGELQRCGCTNSEFRWLLCQGLVEHAREVDAVNGTARAFQKDGELVLHKRTCFVPTEAGVDLARRLRQQQTDRPTDQPTCRQTGADGRTSLGQRDQQSDAERPLKPEWDSDRQELRLGGTIVKQFKVPAVNQERILAAFEEERWPVRIDDPLPPRPEQPPKRRLHDTINSLNRNQKHPLIRFLGDGKGEGIRWNLVLAVSNGAVSNGAVSNGAVSNGKAGQKDAGGSGCDGSCSCA